MDLLLAFAFPDKVSANKGREALKALAGDGTLKLAASIVLARSDTGELVQEHGEHPGALGAGIGAVVGALVGLIGGPGGAAVGLAAGAMSGGIFDVNRAGARDEFLDEVVACLQSGNSAVLAELVELNDAARSKLIAQVAEHGGALLTQRAS